MTAPGRSAPSHGDPLQPSSKGRVVSSPSPTTEFSHVVPGLQPGALCRRHATDANVDQPDPAHVEPSGKPSLSRDAGRARLPSAHVLYLIDGLDEAGCGTVARGAFPPLRRARISLDVAHLKNRVTLRPELEARGATSVLTRRTGGVPGQVWRARQLIRARRPDLVHTTLVEADIVGRLAAATAGIPVVSSLVSSFTVRST